MIWLITQMAGWLILTMACFAVAGWAWAAERAASEDRGLRRERDNIVRDIVRLGAGNVGGDAVERERESDAMRRLVEIRDGRIAALEQSLAAARSRADDAALRVADLERTPAPSQREPAREVEIIAEPVVNEDRLLQAWRLRYFEQRVRYLEGQKTAAAASPELEWRAREAQARAAHLEDEVRALAAAKPAAEVAPFAANAEVDALLRWRMLYLERRAAQLQAQANAAPDAAASPDAEVWMWRARYLEARVRHLEQPLSAPGAAAQIANIVEEQAPPPLQALGTKPSVLPAPRNGLPDDFTLIESLSVLQQSTLNALGVFHFDQIAAWTPENVAWVDNYLYLRGRIEEEEWVEQAGDLVREGVAGSRRTQAEEDA